MNYQRDYLFQPLFVHIFCMATFLYSHPLKFRSAHLLRLERGFDVPFHSIFAFTKPEMFSFCVISGKIWIHKFMGFDRCAYIGFRLEKLEFSNWKRITVLVFLD
jgi:hypothetical protein